MAAAGGATACDRGEPGCGHQWGNWLWEDNTGQSCPMLLSGEFGDDVVTLSRMTDHTHTHIHTHTHTHTHTQVPQFILDEAIMRGRGSKCHVICTQPRRISAISG